MVDICTKITEIAKQSPAKSFISACSEEKQLRFDLPRKLSHGKGGREHDVFQPSIHAVHSVSSLCRSEQLYDISPKQSK